MFEKDIKNPQPNHDPWASLEIVIQEVIQSELLHGLAHSVYLSHTEVKNRSLRLMLECQDEHVKTVERLNALRVRIERWTDVFLGQLPFNDIAIQFAFDAKRRQRVFRASFASDLLRNQTSFPANPGPNQDIAAGILACFPTDRFDSLGLPKSIKLAWLEKAHHDTQMLVDHLVAFEHEAETGFSRIS